MASTITAPTYEPTSTAAALAEKYVTALDSKITSQTTSTAATAKALTTLSSAISAFQTSLASLTGLGKSVLASSAALSDTTIGSASAKPQAAAGSYSLFVQQVATAGQVSYNGVANGSTPGGKLTVKLADESAGATGTPVTFDVDLSAAADTDGDGKLSVRELAAAINKASGNNGQVSAGVVTIGNETRLVLTSKNTGLANTISLDASQVGDTTLQSGLGTRTVVTAAQDAIVLLGGKNGTPIQQASNTFTNIDGVSLTVTRAQSASENPFTLTVGDDDDGTAKNVQAFVDAYNKLKSAIDALLAPGDATAGTAAGGFAHDSGVQALQSQLVSILRPTGSTSLASYGIIANRDGTLALDKDRLTRQLNVDPDGLDKLLGSSSASAPSGAAGALNTYLNQWSNSTNGQLKNRTEANTKAQTAITDLQTKRDDQYNSAYDRYLKKYTDLQTLQSTMQTNLTMLDALFGNDSKS
jgi:flagellar hook-associated protein 2